MLAITFNTFLFKRITIYNKINKQSAISTVI